MGFEGMVAHVSPDRAVGVVPMSQSKQYGPSGAHCGKRRFVGRDDVREAIKPFQQTALDLLVAGARCTVPLHRLAEQRIVVRPSFPDVHQFDEIVLPHGGTAF